MSSGSTMKYFAGSRSWPGAEELAGKSAAGELRARSTGSVHDQDGVAHDPLRVLPRRAVGAVVDAQLRQRLARREREVVDDVVVFGDLRHARGGRLRRKQRREEQRWGEHGTDSKTIDGAPDRPRRL